MKNTPEVSIIVPVTERDRYDDVKELYCAYKRGIASTQKQFEFIYVLDGNFPEVFDDLMELKQSGEDIKILRLAKWFGESVALSAGFEQAAGDIILTLPAYQQVDETEIPRILSSLDGNDMVIACRWPRKDGVLNRLQSTMFHRMVKFITGYGFKDLGSGVRVLRRKVVEEVSIYGDQHRFFPLLATRYGFKVKEIDVEQSQKDTYQRVYSLGVYLRRVLDLISVFFLVKFTKKPLRFFGLTGFFIFAVGALLSLYLFIERVFGGVALRDRPLVLLALLLIVLGIQLFAIGLVGEIIIFTHAKELKEYTIEEIIN